MELHLDKLLIFDIQGPAAHFRKFYTNSSSLSYSFPPRTTITGLIAGMLGRYRDSYYEEFSSRRRKIAISVRTHLRKIMQTVNYVRTKSPGELNLSAGHTQVPLEIILPLRDCQKLRYRIYFYHSGKTMQELKEALQLSKLFYPLYLGISEFIAEVRFVDFIKGNQISRFSNPITPVEIVTAVNAEKISKGGLIFEPNPGEILQYVKERMPLEFNSERRLKSASSFIYERNYNRAKLKVKDDYYKVEYQSPENTILVENIVFMEG